MFEIVDSQATGPVIRVIGVGGAGGNAVNHMIETAVQGVEFICRQHRRPGAPPRRATSCSSARADWARARGPRRRAPQRSPSASASRGCRRAHGIHHRWHGRRHRNRRRAGNRRGRARSRHPDGGGGDQAVHLRRLKRMKVAEQGIEELVPHVDSLIVILNDKLEERSRRGRDPGGRVQGGRRRAEQRGRRHRGDHQPARAGERRVPGREDGDVGAGHGDDGLRLRERHRPRANCGRAGDRLPAARGRQPGGRAACSSTSPRRGRPQAARDQR